MSKPTRRKPPKVPPQPPGPRMNLREYATALAGFYAAMAKLIIVNSFQASLSFCT